MRNPTDPEIAQQQQPLRTSTRALCESELVNSNDEAFITHAMGAGPYHRIRLGAIFRIENILQDFHDKVRFSLRDETDALKDRETWSKQHEKVFKECFEPPKEDLVTGDYLGIRQVGEELRVVYQFIIDLSEGGNRRFMRFCGHRGINWFLDITCDTLEGCEEIWEMVRKRYFVMHGLTTSRKNMPTVKFLSQEHGRPKLISMKMADDRQMRDDELRLHYGGDEILTYEEDFMKSLKEDAAGLHLLQGAPGVGKTSLLLHLIAKIKNRHHLIYLPTQHFESISSPESISFWAGLAEQREEGTRTVLIVEDAEALIQAREQVSGYQASMVSNLLNCTDGILGQALGLHVVATFNTHVDKIDPALLRSGRLKSYREFKPLAPDQAADLASHLGRKLDVQREEYTLAEIYCGEQVKKESEAQAMGFRQGH